MDGDEPSSIIIDTKVTTGVPVLSKKQREEYIRKNYGGHDSASDDGNNNQTNSKDKVVNLKSQINLQEQITQILFKFIEQGNIERLKKEQQLLGLMQPDDISLLVDDTNYNQNALFTSVQIKDD